MVIQSHRGPYTVDFDDDALAHLDADVPAGAHFLVDARVAELHGADLRRVLASRSVLTIAATEAAKSLDRFPAYVERLVERGVRRGHVLVVVGGGITQDIACFLAATLLRGLEWRFYPTTLLAQADSCIGSKSSINVGEIKNVLGTFTPPSRIVIGGRVLATLDERDLRSGIGEMLKVHAIAGPDAFDRIAADYPRLLSDPALLRSYIRASLEIKRRIIEEDEFDRGIRNVMNYGHSFGHAIESATAYAVPHGIAVTIGMDMANYT
ncbi:MAG: 3-dehydroquinate synthase, partial [Chloroflexota bacterium]